MGKRLTVTLAVFAFVAVLLGAYTTGYLLLGELNYWSSDGVGRFDRVVPGMTIVARSYRQEWMTTVFQPAAKVDGWLRGVEVEVWWEETPRPTAEPLDS